MGLGTAQGARPVWAELPGQMAEAEGFEPSMGFKAQTALAVCWAPSGQDRRRPAATHTPSSAQVVDRSGLTPSDGTLRSWCHPRAINESSAHPRPWGRDPGIPTWTLRQFRARTAHEPLDELADDPRAVTADGVHRGREVVPELVIEPAHSAELHLVHVRHAGMLAGWLTTCPACVTI